MIVVLNCLRLLIVNDGVDVLLVPGCAHPGHLSEVFSSPFVHSAGSRLPTIFLFSKMQYLTISVLLAAPLAALAAPTRLVGKRAESDIVVFSKSWWFTYHMVTKVSSTIRICQGP